MLDLIEEIEAKLADMAATIAFNRALLTRGK